MTSTGNTSMRWIKNAGKIIASDECVIWKLPDILILHEETRCCVSSPQFKYAGQIWRLTAIPYREFRGPSYNYLLTVARKSNYIGFCIWNETRKSSNSVYHVKLGIYRSDGTVLESCKGETFSGDFGKQKFISTNNILEKNISFNGLMKFFCEIQKKENGSESYLDDENEDDESDEDENEDDESEDESEDNENEGDISEDDMSEEETCKDSNEKGVIRLLQNFKDLYHSGKGSDAVLKVEDREFPVHKAILGARSPVFESMFEHDMTEKNSGIVDIPDCSAAAFNVLLEYIYTGSVATLSTNIVFNLYYAADKYRIDDLKADCVACMKDNLSVDTFCDVISLSLRHCESGLQKAATHFFCKNAKKIVKTLQWQKYLKENATHANELIIKLLNA